MSDSRRGDLGGARVWHPSDDGGFQALLSHAPQLRDGFISFSRVALRDELDLAPRIREAVVLRIAVQRSCGYVWAHHVPIAQDVGLSLDEVALIRDRPASLPDEIRLAVLLADAVDSDHMTDNLWVSLSAAFNQTHLVELVMVAAGYGMTCRAQNTLRPVIREGLHGFEFPTPHPMTPATAPSSGR